MAGNSDSRAAISVPEASVVSRIVEPPSVHPDGVGILAPMRMATQRHLASEEEDALLKGHVHNKPASASPAACKERLCLRAWSIPTTGWLARYAPGCQVRC